MLRIMATTKRPTKPTPKKGGRSCKPTPPTQPAAERTASRPDWHPAFLRALASSCNITAACRAAGVHRDTFYAHRKAHPAFAAQVKEAFAEAIESLEGEMYRRAVDGCEKPVLHQGVQVLVWVDAEGRQVAPDAPGARAVPLVLREYSDTLAIFLAKAHRPKKYRERYEVKHKGQVKLTKAEELNDAELARIAAGGDPAAGRGRAAAKAARPK